MTGDTFDPYLQWLGIPPHERPLDHYRLLGVPLFESDARRIEEAADARMNLVRSYQSGPRVAHTQKLLNELSAARLCLTNPQSKASYDAVLRGRQALGAVTSPAGPTPAAGPGPGPMSPAPAIPTPVIPTLPAGLGATGWNPVAPGYGPAMGMPVPGAPMAMPVSSPMAAPYMGGIHPAPHAAPMAIPLSPQGGHVYPGAAYPVAIPYVVPQPVNPGQPMNPGMPVAPGIPVAPGVPLGAPSPPVPAGPLAAPPPAPPPPPPPTTTARAGSTKGAQSQTTRPEPLAPPVQDDSSSGSGSADSWATRRRIWVISVVAVGVVVGTGLAGWRIMKGRGTAGDSAQQTAPEKTTEVIVVTDGKREDTRGKNVSRTTIDDPFGAVEIAQEGTGELHFPAQIAEVSGEGLSLEVRGDDQVMAGWGGASAQSLAWNFRLVKPDIFRVEITYAATDAARGGRLVLTVDGDEPKSSEIAATGGLESFRTDILHVTVPRGGKHRLTLHVEGVEQAGGVVFKTMHFLPKGIGDKKKNTKPAS